MLREDDLFAGYAIERLLGRGGMGSVYLARHPRLPKRIALKLLNRDLGSDSEIRARFEREADLSARLDHPNVVSVYDRGLDQGQLWIAMQYVEGVDASSVTPDSVSPQRAAAIVADTAKALDYAHGLGVLHRDVKPGNILLGRAASSDWVMLSDFGIARMLDDTKHLTRTGSFLATIAYASPEQLSGEPLDHRSDQYSLACTLYWMLTGVTPFHSDNPGPVIQGHLMRPPPPVSQLRPSLPPHLNAVLAQALSKDPNDRFPTCSAFSAAAVEALAPAHPQPSGYPPRTPTERHPNRVAETVWAARHSSDFDPTTIVDQDWDLEEDLEPTSAHPAVRVLAAILLCLLIALVTVAVLMSLQV